jgi:uncharacterized protein YndB with AHSA1/START domain
VSDVTASVTIDAPPEAVFRFFVEPELLTQWLGTWAELRPEAGGVFAVDVGRPARGTYVEVEPPRRVVFTWGVLGNETFPPGSSTVEILLTADGEQTHVTLTHRDLPAEERPSHQRGWTQLVEALRTAAT